MKDAGLTTTWTAGTPCQHGADSELILRLKRLIIDSCDLDLDADDIDADAPLFGRQSALGLDSIDALQISVAVQGQFGVAIRDSKQMRRVMASIRTFAEFLQARLPT